MYNDPDNQLDENNLRITVD
jgi:hypothetical protein